MGKGDVGAGLLAKATGFFRIYAVQMWELACLR